MVLAERSPHGKSCKVKTLSIGIFTMLFRMFTTLHISFIIFGLCANLSCFLHNKHDKSYAKVLLLFELTKELIEKV